MINLKLTRVAFLAILAGLSLLIGANWSENPGPPSLEESLLSGIPGFAANNQAPPFDERSAAEQEALVQEIIANLWRYEASPESPRPQPRATNAQNGLIVFVDENGRLSQANPDGSKKVVLNNAINNAESPQWSPDEKRISFVGDKQGSGGKCIYILRHSDRQLSTVTCEPAVIQDPHWSPDGQSLAFFGHMNAGDADKRGWVVPANGGALKEIAPSLLNIWTPKWIDHDTVVFSGENPADSWRIYRADAGSLGSAKPVTPVFTCECTADSIVAAQPILSPDKKWVAFVAARTEGGKSSSLVVAAVYIVDPEGARTPVKLGDIADTSAGTGYYGHMYWAPNNQQIGVLASGSDQMMRLNLLRVDSEDVTTLRSREGGSWSNWDWAPDGRLIAGGHQRPGQAWEVNTLYLGSDSFQRLIPGHSPTWRNATEAECSGIDESKTPIMLVTGWGGSENSSLSKDEQLHRFIEYLAPHGYKEGCNLFYATGTSAHRSLHDNGHIIHDRICSDYDIVKNLNPEWTGEFNLIGYSYGGLRARYFLESDDIYNGGQGADCDGGTVRVENLITIGTPHGGEPYPTYLDVLPFAFFIGICSGGLDLCDLPSGEWDPEFIALREMLPSNRQTENLLHKQPAGTCYHLLSGDARSQIDKAPLLMQDAINAWPFVEDNPNDFAVHRASAHGLDNSNYPSVNRISSLDVHGYVPELDWWSGPHDLISFVEPIDTFNAIIWPLLQQPCADDRTDQEAVADIDLAQEAAQLRQATTTAAAPRRDLAIDVLAPGQSKTGAFTVTEGGDSHVTIFWNDGELAFTLTDPSGNVIAPQSNTPGVSYLELGLGFGLMADYHLDDMMPGTWGYSLTISNVEYPVPFRLLYQAGRNIGAGLSVPQWLIAGEPLPLSVVVRHNGIPLTGGAVSARIERPNNAEVVLALYDDGTHGDGAAGDGVFANTYMDTNLGGYYDIVIKATGEVDAVPYERTNSAAVAVAPSTELTGNYRDEGVDAEGDGYYESLVFEAEVDVAETGDYLIKAELWAGNRLITEAEGRLPLTPGKRWLPVFFDGNDIRQSGRNGPYKVRNLLLIDQTQASILIDAVDEVHQTGPYNHRLFGTPFKAYVPLVKKNP